MAGRKPRKPLDEQQGNVTPLQGRRPGPRSRQPSARHGDTGDWTEAFESQRPPFGKGHIINQVHGARNNRDVAVRARAILNEAVDNEAMPDHLRSVPFRAAVEAWARTEAMASLIWDYLVGLDPEDMMTARLGGTKSPVDLWQILENRAATMRGRLGLDPVSYAKIMKDLGLTEKRIEDGLARLAGKGAEIVSKRGEIESGSGADGA